MALWNFLGGLVEPITNLIDDMHTSDEEKAAAKLQLQALLTKHEQVIVESKKEVIVAEAKSEHKLAAIWRPITMLSFTAIIINNYILYPYLQLFFDTGVMLNLPPQMWELLKIGLGGYIIGRSAEKGVKLWKNK